MNNEVVIPLSFPLSLFLCVPLFHSLSSLHVVLQARQSVLVRAVLWWCRGSIGMLFLRLCNLCMASQMRINYLQVHDRDFKEFYNELSLPGCVVVAVFLVGWCDWWQVRCKIQPSNKTPYWVKVRHMKCVNITLTNLQNIYRFAKSTLYYSSIIALMN